MQRSGSPLCLVTPCNIGQSRDIPSSDGDRKRSDHRRGAVDRRGSPQRLRRSLTDQFVAGGATLWSAGADASVEAGTDASGATGAGGAGGAGRGGGAIVPAYGFLTIFLMPESVRMGHFFWMMFTNHEGSQPRGSVCTSTEIWVRLSPLGVSV